MNVNVSEKVENRLKELASRSGQNAEDFAGVLLEEIVEEKTKGNGQTELREQDNKSEESSKARKRSLLEFAGMFSGGDGRTSENFKKILREEIDSVAGFTTDKKED